MTFDIKNFPRLRQWQDRGTIEQLCDHGIFCIDEQSSSKETRPSVLLIHGFPTASFDFVDIWPTLNQEFRLISLDMLGFGFSDKPNKRNYTIHRQADLFEALLKQKGIEHCHVLAHDYGVSVAQELLARQQESNLSFSIKSCCFLNGGLFPETHRALLIQKLMLSPLGKWLYKLLGFKQFTKSFSSVFGVDTQPSENALKEFWALISHKQGRHLFHNLMTYILDRRQFRERWLQALRRSQAPLGVINGSVDPVSGSHLVERYKELECRLDYLVELAEIGHYPQVEAPSKVANAYLDFLSGLS